MQTETERDFRQKKKNEKEKRKTHNKCEQNIAKLMCTQRRQMQTNGCSDSFSLLLEFSFYSNYEFLFRF